VNAHLNIYVALPNGVLVCPHRRRQVSTQFSSSHDRRLQEGGHWESNNCLGCRSRASSRGSGSFLKKIYILKIELEAILLVTGALDFPDRPGPNINQGDEDDDPSSRMRSAATSTNFRPQKNIRQQKANDSDSDFEFDM